ncbi:MAG: M1 family metallopeptidase [Gemmatimonadota bacterium]
MRRTSLALAFLCGWLSPAAAQTPTYERADTLRGSYTSAGRSWWDVTFYDLQVAINPQDSSIRGSNAITYRVLAPGRELQVDLMEPLIVDSMTSPSGRVRFRRDGRAYFARAPLTGRGQSRARTGMLTVYYHGKPQPAKRPPWDGGFSWGADSLGRTWVVTTDQGMGASVWWPNKDTQADEPDSQRVALTLPDSMIDVSNGRLRRVTQHDDGTTTWEWFVTSPINNYAIAVAAGHYTHYSDLFWGEGGPLTMDFWPLDYHMEAARRQWVQARSMLQCFEHWFGPYPWYADGYKLIEVSNNGMEHQSAVAYGNRFANGYQGRDASGTGLGLKFDFIIVHESAHEWFGNNITTRDLADMWVHESFANYAEGIYAECQFGKQAGSDYVIGNRRGIRNDRPIVPPNYGVNAQGSGDMYPKGGEMLHTIRQIVGDDEKWRGILRGLNHTFWHQTVTGSQVEQYIGKASGSDLTRVFDQYLRTTKVPVFEYRITGDSLQYRWADVVSGFNMQVPVTLSDSTAAGPQWTILHPAEAWQTSRIQLRNPADFKVDPNYYVLTRDVSAGGTK